MFRKKLTMKKTVTAETLFEDALKTRGMHIKERKPDGTYVVAIKDANLIVSLDNVRRNYERDHDAFAISRFVDTLLETGLDFPSWEMAKTGLRFKAEPSDYDFGDTVREAITDKFCKVLVYVDKEEKRITWINDSQLKDWGVSKEQAFSAAKLNMAHLMERIEIKVEHIDQHPIAMFDMDSSFKASIIFSPNFQEKMRKKIGWPVYVVIPCRDFAYAFSVKDKDLINRIGKVVVHEFKKSGYPITTEVLQISDSGIEAIGEFPVD